MTILFPRFSSSQAFDDYLLLASVAAEPPLDKTEALPVADVEYIDIDDVVRFEYLDNDGYLHATFEGKVIEKCYESQRVLVYVKDAGALWCRVERISLVINGKAVCPASIAEQTA